MEIPFLGKFGPKNQNYQFKLKFGTYTNSNMQNSLGMFLFFCFWSEIHFLGKFGPKNQNYQFKLKFATYTNLKMKNWIVMFTFSVFDWEYAFWATLIQKIKIVSWRWKSILKLIQICRIQYGCSFLLFLIKNMYFGKIWSKKLKFSVQGEIWYLH